jgi:hypothetical protein
MVYLYMHIPHIFSTGFFQESKLTTAALNLKEDSIKSVMKRCFLQETPLQCSMFPPGDTSSVLSSNRGIGLAISVSS